jgi:ferredoxin
MKFTVDQNLCIGCEACEGISPEVFTFPNDKSQVKLNPVPLELQESTLEAEANCPVGAISHVA